ncbi:MAG: hypothetical protein IT276_17025 [Ignavibacteriaceae bacterium]|nr:hypothetical protein [Ignavibacteriaceae bacterium]HMN24166.1 hypothetical protein [Ignavibacteriaceae bacterium]HRN24976.1 hypothetical protein [Ignavibacteriaceae bacterium]HRP93582.1 hypothetical protein [Ignavibacteriaceae bacterium]HRQ52644.1 hypothetical protein [Ignavibacteriaceae bacterium]
MNNLPAEFLDDVEKFSQQSLKRKDDLSILVKAYDENGKIEDFENLSFTGKYINGLFTVLKNSVNIPEVESVDHIKKDLSENMEKVISQLKEITFKMDDEKKIIEENYFTLNQSSLQNLRQLVEDLDIIKKYLNHLKRN